jgi:riboflavin transporter FmnP
MNEKKREIIKNSIFTAISLILTILTINYLVNGHFLNWIEYQIVITLSVVLIFFTIFFFFTSLHHVIRRD